MDNKTIISKVLPKEKAEEKYTYEISLGNTGILLTMDETRKSYIINVGNVLPNERVVLKSIFNQMIISQVMRFIFLECYFVLSIREMLYNRKKLILSPF